MQCQVVEIFGVLLRCCAQACFVAEQENLLVKLPVYGPEIWSTKGLRREIAARKLHRVIRRSCRRRRFRR